MSLLMAFPDHSCLHCECAPTLIRDKGGLWYLLDSSVPLVYHYVFTEQDRDPLLIKICLVVWLTVVDGLFMFLACILLF